MKSVIFNTREFVVDCDVTPNTKKVLSPLPQGAQRRLNRQILCRQSLQLVVATKPFMMCRLLKSTFLVLCRFVSAAVGHYNLVSFLVFYLALSVAALQYNSVSCPVFCLAVSPVIRH